MTDWQTDERNDWLNEWLLENFQIYNWAEIKNWKKNWTHTDKWTISVKFAIGNLKKMKITWKYYVKLKKTRVHYKSIEIKNYAEFAKERQKYWCWNNKKGKKN